MTPKQRVLRYFPTARVCYDRKWNKVIGCGISFVLGKTWTAAARKLAERKARK